jgi:hypothetical protein
MVGGEKRELRRQATDIGRKERRNKMSGFPSEIDLSCCNLASWWVPPSTINPVQIRCLELEVVYDKVF